MGVILVELVSKFNTEFERREILYGLKKSCYPEYLKKDLLKEYNFFAPPDVGKRRRVSCPVCISECRNDNKAPPERPSRYGK